VKNRGVYGSDGYADDHAFAVSCYYDGNDACFFDAY
jgi:hypothetical protein